MQHRLAIKHLSGSKVSTIDRIVMPPEREIIFGRDRECHVRYDEADDLVSRKHLKIAATDEEPARYMVVDLGSRNGTFLNRQRVFGAVSLLPGSRIQLGPGGPECEFELDKEEVLQPNGNSKRASEPWFAKGVLVMFLLVGVGAVGYAARTGTVFLWRDWHTTRAERPPKPTFTPAAALASVAGTEGEWNAFDKQTGARLARAYIAIERIALADRLPLLEGAPASLPAFVLGEDHRIEPLLVTAGTAHAGQAVGGRWSSRGVIVSPAGSVLTPAPDQRSWNGACHWKSEESAGVLVVLESQKITQVVPLAAAQFPPCAPDRPGFLATQLPEGLQGEVNGRRLSSDDLRIVVTARVTASGQAAPADLVGESSGLWLLSMQSRLPLANLRIAPLDDAPVHSMDGRPVWAVGSAIEAGELRNTTAEGRIALHGARCGGGGIVFDQKGRVLALCSPDPHPQTEPGFVIPIHRSLLLSGRTTDVQSK